MKYFLSIAMMFMALGVSPVLAENDTSDEVGGVNIQIKSVSFDESDDAEVEDEDEAVKDEDSDEAEDAVEDIDEAEDADDADDSDDAEKPKDLREVANGKLLKAKELKGNSAEHRSAVANFVLKLLDVSDRQALGGIGEKVREVAKEQNASEDVVTPKLERIENKNRARKFLFGTDFKNAKEVKKQMQDAKTRLEKLKTLSNDFDSAKDKTAIVTQITELRANLDSTLKDVEAEEGKFSLFGWVKRMFLK